MLKFYQYIIYKLYTWRLEKNDDTPIATVVLLLSMVHMFYLVMIYYIGMDLLGLSMYLIKPKSFLTAAIFTVFIVLNYFVLYDKKAWDRYIERFQNESEEERTCGSFAVIGYCVGSALLFFVVIITYFSLRH